MGAQMQSGKVTLSQLRTEAHRVFGECGVADAFVVTDVCLVHRKTTLLEVRGSSKMKARRRMLALLKALPTAMDMP